jgi:AraC family transcriptional regulator
MRISVEHSLGISKSQVELRSYAFDGAFEKVLQSDDRCFFDFSLTPRTGAARGRYEGLWGPTRTEEIGEVLFVPAGMALRGSCAAGQHQSLSCMMDASLFELDGKRLDDEALAETLHLHNRAVRRGLVRILREVTRPSLASPLAIDACLTLLGVDVARHFQGREAARRKKGGLSPAQMRTLEDRIRSLAPLPTVSELATACGVSERHLARAFLQETGRTLGEYVTSAGVERAWRLLTETNTPIKQIAAQLGFATGASFAFAFRRATGRRPRDVRGRTGETLQRVA